MVKFPKEAEVKGKGSSKPTKMEGVKPPFHQGPVREKKTVERRASSSPLKEWRGERGKEEVSFLALHNPKGERLKSMGDSPVGAKNMNLLPLNPVKSTPKGRKVNQPPVKPQGKGRKVNQPAVKSPGKGRKVNQSPVKPQGKVFSKVGYKGWVRNKKGSGASRRGFGNRKKRPNLPWFMLPTYLKYGIKKKVYPESPLKKLRRFKQFFLSKALDKGGVTKTKNAFAHSFKFGNVNVGVAAPLHVAYFAKAKP